MKYVAIALGTLALATAAPARTPRTTAWQVGTDSYHLYYEDLAIDTVAGRATLLKRVEALAARLCDLPVAADQRACVEEVLAGIHKPELQQARAERDAPVVAANR